MELVLTTPKKIGFLFYFSCYSCSMIREKTMQEDQDDFNPLLEDFQNDVRKIVLYGTFQLRNYVFL